MPIRATVRAAVGLHARPAAEFVRAVTESGYPVRLCREGGDTVDARSLLEVMTADFCQGETVELSVDSTTPSTPDSPASEAADEPEAQAVLQGLKELLESQN